LYLFLFLFWIIANGKITMEIVLFGFGITAALALFMKLLFSYTIQKEIRVLKKLPVFVIYLCVLVWEILKANVIMAGYILHKDRKIDPVIVSFQSGLKTALGRFILANSITLTPGTITVEEQGDHFTVHCLHRSLLDISEDSVFIRWIRRLEK